MKQGYVFIRVCPFESPFVYLFVCLSVCHSCQLEVIYVMLAKERQGHVTINVVRVTLQTGRHHTIATIDLFSLRN